MKFHINNRDISFHRQSATQTDLVTGENIISPAFCDFVAKYVNKLDFRSYGHEGKNYSRLAVPTVSIRESLLKALKQRQESHEHWVKPTSDILDQRNLVFSPGYLALDDHLEGVCHLRIEHEDRAYIWIATSTPLNGIEALEAAMWFLAVNGFIQRSRKEQGLSAMNYAPVPLAGSQTVARHIDGPVLKVPPFAERTAALLQLGAEGWRLDGLTVNQRSLVSPLLKNGIRSGTSLDSYAEAYFDGIKALASGEGYDEAVLKVAETLASNIEKFHKRPSLAQSMGKRLVDSILRQHPTIEDSYARKRKGVRAAERADKQARDQWNADFFKMSSDERKKVVNEMFPTF